VRPSYIHIVFNTVRPGTVLGSGRYVTARTARAEALLRLREPHDAGEP
jgi:hypothetical protein